MTIVFFGLGSIGQRHAKMLKRFKKHKLFAFRSGRQSRVNTLGIPEVYTWEDVERLNPDVAFITNPTSMHVDTALQCARRGIHLFIEKPIGHSVKGLTELEKAVQKKRLVTYVAYVLRFHPIIQKLKKAVERNPYFHARVMTSSFLPAWRHKGSKTKNYSAYKKMGGGVILDLSHELDFVEYIFGPVLKMTAQFDKRSHVTHDAEDYADILVETKRGPVNVHMNFLSQIQQRVIQIDFRDISLEGDFIHGTLKTYRAGRVVKLERFEKKYKESFDRQLSYFLKNINNKRMMNNLEEAIPLFKKIERLLKHGQY